MYKLCGKCEYYTDKCKNQNNVNYNTFRDYFDVCSNKKVDHVERENKKEERALRHFIRHKDDL